MSYTVVPPSGPRARPTAVALATMLMFAVAGLIVITGVLAVVEFQTIDTPVPANAGQIDPELLATSSVIGIVLALVLYAVLAAGHVTLAIFVGQGKNPARIVTWVVTGLTVLCCGCGLLGDVFGGAVLGSLDPSSQSKLNEINDATPLWLSVATSTTTVLIVVALVAVIILLALPVSNDYFRKEQEVWVPPTWPSGGLPPMGPGGVPPIGPSGVPPIGPSGVPPIGPGGVPPIGPGGVPPMPMPPVPPIEPGGGLPPVPGPADPQYPPPPPPAGGPGDFPFPPPPPPR